VVQIAEFGGAKIATAAHTVNGMPWSGNNYLLDGVVNNEMQNAYVNITPPLEAIQEFKFQTNNHGVVSPLQDLPAPPCARPRPPWPGRDRLDSPPQALTIPLKSQSSQGP
jgi:hypothetical protein